MSLLGLFSSCGKQGPLSSCGARASRCSRLSCCGAQPPGHAGSATVAPRLCRHSALSRSTTCGILPDQGLNPCLLHWQADSLPLSHQETLDTSHLLLLAAAGYFKVWICRILSIYSPNCLRPPTPIKKSAVTVFLPLYHMGHVRISCRFF